MTRGPNQISLFVKKRSPKANAPTSKANNEKGKPLDKGKTVVYFNCRGPLMIRDCPRKEWLSAITVRANEVNDSPRVNPLVLLNALT